MYIHLKQYSSIFTHILQSSRHRHTPLYTAHHKHTTLSPRRRCIRTPHLVTDIVNMSLRESMIPKSLKTDLIRPLLKKTGLDSDILKNYRPVSNLTFISKVIEQVISGRLNEHLINNSLFDPLQSAYRDKHSTETALLKVQNDIISALDAGCCCCLPTPMTLASGRSPMFPLVVHQPASPCIWPAVQSIRRGLSTNPGVTMWCVCGFICHFTDVGSLCCVRHNRSQYLAVTIM